MAEDKEQRTERATPKRREEARKKGDVAKSREVSSVAVLMAALAALYFSGMYMFEGLMEVTGAGLLDAGTFPVTRSSMLNLLVETVSAIGRISFPVILGVFLAAAVSNIAQVGFLVTTEPLTPKIEKINPLKGLQRLLSLYSVVELLKSILKIVIVSTVAFFAIRAEAESIPPLMLMSPWEIVAFISGVSFRILFKCAWVLLILAAVDYAYQRWEYERKLRMTKQEIKDELKQSEGDPKVKSKLRALQREGAMRRMMEEVPKADVVITNPTHYAVALRYRKEEAEAPRVVAKGKDHLALRIKKAAEEAGIPIVEDKPLARTLYKSIEVGQEIPVSLYKAVAEILAYVYRLSGKVAA